ncbi:hypothetical protein L218DRAFT_333422 [Marasmius fiardii PR-910]|nr:hypothetical protein L218DRAFT_333422 [Marasmius fiardii PR-910]
MGYQPWEVVPLETQFQELDKDSDDNSYSLDILFDGNQGLSESTPHSQPPHSLNTVLIGKSLGTCQVMKPVRLPSMLAPHYTRMLASADQCGEALVANTQRLEQRLDSQQLVPRQRQSI